MRYVGKQLIKIPTLALIYNKCMGGTDTFDQMCSYYRTTIKTKRWQTRIFTHFLMAAAVNSHILFKLGGGEEMKDGGLKRDDRGFELLDFIGMLVDQLCTKLPVNKLKDSAHPNRYIGCHVPLRYENLIDPKTGKRIENRRVCANEDCKERTFESCKTCDIHLCFYPCWEQCHTPK
jgi:hypothetical protein